MHHDISLKLARIGLKTNGVVTMFARHGGKIDLLSRSSIYNCQRIVDNYQGRLNLTPEVSQPLVELMIIVELLHFSELVGGGGSYRILGTTLCFFGLSNVITYAFNMTAYILLNQYFTYIFLHCRNLFLCNIRCYSLKKQVFCELLTNEDHLAKSAQLLPQKHTSAYHMQPLYVHNAFQVEVEHPVEYVQ